MLKKAKWQNIAGSKNFFRVNNIFSGNCSTAILILEKKILGELQRLQHFQQVQLVKEKSVAYLLQPIQNTTKMFQVKPVEGKGFGIVATKCIKKGVLILQEDPQIQIEPNEESQRGEDLMSSILANPGSWKVWINKLWSLFNQMEESDQNEYLKLYNSFEEAIHVLGKVMLLVLVNQMKENEEDDAEKILDIVFIYFSNYRIGGKVMIKMSRFNHSCRPNAVLKSGSNQIWTISDIKPGQEISIDYCSGEGFLGLRSKESRKIYVHESVLGEEISCSCDFCKDEQGNLLRIVGKKTVRR